MSMGKGWKKGHDSLGPDQTQQSGFKLSDTLMAFLKEFF